MKKSLWIVLIILTGSILTRGNPDNKEKDSGLLRETAIVNAYDTVVVDLSQAVISGNYIDIPVSFLSDDTIYALDFSLQYDQASLTYDSMINHTNYIQAFSFYNTTDSTLRFTSNSFQNYTNDTALVSIRFVMLSAQISSSDFYQLRAYLNGDSCSIKVTNLLSTGIPDMNDNSLVKVYPNPASGILNIEVVEKATIQLMDMNGRQVMISTIANENQNQEINIQTIPNGCYLMRIFTNNFLVMKRVIINR